MALIMDNFNREWTQMNANNFSVIPSATRNPALSIGNGLRFLAVLGMTNPSVPIRVYSRLPFIALAK
jgi:hypothetical protein